MPDQIAIDVFRYDDRLGIRVDVHYRGCSVRFENVEEMWWDSLSEADQYRWADAMWGYLDRTLTDTDGG